MINLYFFSQRYQLQPLHNQNINITITSVYNLPVELFDLNNIFKEMSIIYGRLINQFKFKHLVVFSVIFDKETHEEIEQFFSLKVNQSSTRIDIGKYDLERELDGQIENLERKIVSGWRFSKTVTMTIYF